MKDPENSTILNELHTELCIPTNSLPIIPGVLKGFCIQLIVLRGVVIYVEESTGTGADYSYGGNAPPVQFSYLPPPDRPFVPVFFTCLDFIII